MRFKRIFYYYWQQVRKYPWSFSLTFVAYGMGLILASILSPFLYKKIIDLISGATPNAALSVALFEYVVLIAGTVVIYNLFFRAGDYFISYFQANVIREIHNDTFHRLMNHSYRFFANNFSGSLVSKAKRFAGSFERISDIISFQFWFTFVHLASVCIVLFLNAPLVAGILLGWAVLYIAI